MAEEAQIKKIPPRDITAEQAVIGSMLMSKDAIMAASERLSSSDFFDKRYGIIFEAITELDASGKNADPVTIQSKLKEKELPPEYAGPDIMKEIMDAVPISPNARQYADIVYDKSMLRKLIKVTEGITNECYLDKSPVAEIMEGTEKKIFDIIQSGHGGNTEDIRNIMLHVLDSIEAAAKTTGTVTGISTGFYDLDYKTAGLQKSDLILIAARPSMGKTAFTLNIAEHVAIKQGIPTAIFSLEMSREQLAKRILSMNSRVDAQKLRTGELADSDWADIMESTRIIGNANLFIDDTPGISVAELRSKCRKLKLEKNLGLVMIDYLQLMTGSKKTESRQQEISDISRSLKALAREIDAPVIALSQLSRQVEQREDKRPMLSDLRESGAIEQDADVVMFIYRDEYYHKDSEETGISEIIIGKQRNGPTGTVKLGWQSQFTKFVNIERGK